MNDIEKKKRLWNGSKNYQEKKNLRVHGLETCCQTPLFVVLSRIHTREGKPVKPLTHVPETVTDNFEPKVVIGQ